MVAGTIGLHEVSTGASSFSLLTSLGLALFLLFNAIEELLNIVLVFEGVTEHLEIGTLPSPFEALLRTLSNIIYHFTADGG